MRSADWAPQSPSIERGLIERRGWLRPDDLKEALAFTKPLPGSTVVQIVAFLGWRLLGWPGTLAATLGFLLPAAALMTAAAAMLDTLPASRWLDGALTGIHVVVIGLLASTLYNLARGEAKSGLMLAVLIAAGAVGPLVNAAIVVLGAGLAGTLATRKQEDLA